MTLGIYSLPLRVAVETDPPGSGNYLTLGPDRLRLGPDYLVLNPGPFPEPMFGLVEAAGALVSADAAGGAGGVIVEGG